MMSDNCYYDSKRPRIEDNSFFKDSNSETEEEELNHDDGCDGKPLAIMAVSSESFESNDDLANKDDDESSEYSESSYDLANNVLAKDDNDDVVLANDVLANDDDYDEDILSKEDEDLPTKTTINPSLVNEGAKITKIPKKTWKEIFSRNNTKEDPKDDPDWHLNYIRRKKYAHGPVGERHPDSKIPFDPDWNPKDTQESIHMPPGTESGVFSHPTDAEQVLGARQATEGLTFDVHLSIKHSCIFWKKYTPDQKMCIQVTYKSYDIYKKRNEKISN